MYNFTFSSAQKTNMMKEAEKYFKKCSKEDATGKLQNLIIEASFIFINSLIEYKHEHFIKLAYCGLNGETD